MDIKTNSVVLRRAILPGSTLPAPAGSNLPDRPAGDVIDLNGDGQFNTKTQQHLRSTYCDALEPSISSTRLDELRLMAQASSVQVVTQDDVADPGAGYARSRAGENGKGEYRYNELSYGRPSLNTLGQLVNHISAKEGFGIGHKWAIDFTNPSKPEFLIYK